MSGSVSAPTNWGMATAYPPAGAAPPDGLPAGGDYYGLWLFAGKQFYGGSDWAPLGLNPQIDQLSLNWNALTLTMIQIGPDEMERRANVRNFASPYPTHWAWVGQSLRVWPIPGATIGVNVLGRWRLPPISADEDANAWTQDAQDLIAAAARRILFSTIERDPDQAQAAAAVEALQLAALRGENTSRDMPRRTRPMRF